MSPTPPRPADVFYCPACGQKHRGDLTAARDGAAIKVRCAGCRASLQIEWDVDEPRVTMLEPPPKAAAAGGDDDDDEEGEEEDEDEEEGEAKGDEKGAPKGAGGDPAGTTTAKAAAKPADGKPGLPLRSRAGKRPKDAAALARARERRAKRGDSGGERTEKPAEVAEPAIQAEYAPGTRLGRYTLEAAIGQGGTGTVYRAFDPTTNRYVALKLIAGDQSEAMRRRFRREIEVEANLRHPNLMPVFDRGEHEGRPYFTMELLYRPFTLTQIVTMAKNGTLSRYATLKPYGDVATLVREVFLPVCEGLQVANVENGVIHRDLKPDNVLVDSRTLRPYVIDFGICFVLERTSRTAGVALAPTTGDADIVGTPRFLAPEQARGTAHERTDVWGLGALLRYCLTGEPPLAAAAGITRAELRQRVDALEAAKAAAKAAGDAKKASLCDEKLARLKDPTLRTMDVLFEDAREGVYPPLPSTVPAGLAAIVRKAMAPKTADRYVNPRSLAADVESWLAGTQTRAGAAEGTSTATVVASVGTALRRNLATAFFVLVGAGAGILIGRSMASKGPTTVAVDAASSMLAGFDGLDRRLDALAASATRFTPVDAARTHDALAGEASERLEAAQALVPGPERDAAVSRATSVARRLAPSWIRFEAATPVGKVRVEDLVRGGEPTERDGASLRLPPGEWRLSVGSIRIPLVLPLLVREKGQDAEREPARVTVRIPIAAGSIPDGMVLVVSGDGEVDYRGPPWSSAPVVRPRVAPFLMDRHETSNAEWEKFLDDLGDDELRKARVPAVDFVVDAERPGRFMVPRSGSVGVATSELPVRGVSPDDALAYCGWRSRRDGAPVRLPTEAEWAVAAGVLLRHELLPGGAHGTPDEGDYAAPVPVKSVRDVSPYGVAGLLGNARELVTALGAADGAAERFLSKGAGAGDAPEEAMIQRVRVVPRDAKDPKTGLRCVRDLTAKPAGR